MEIKYIFTTAAIIGSVLVGCDKSAETTAAPAAPEPVAAETPEITAPEPTEVAESTEAEPAESGESFSEAGEQTYLDPIALAPFTSKVMHIGDVSKGHFNLYIEGGEPAAVRAWIGDEAATDVMVTKAEFEVDHHCAHIEVAQPLPEGAKFWLEIETADGQRLKGSSALK